MVIPGTCSDHILHILNDVLDMAKLQANMVCVCVCVCVCV
jgi:hypothetical protein